MLVKKINQNLLNDLKKEKDSKKNARPINPVIVPEIDGIKIKTNISIRMIFVKIRIFKNGIFLFAGINMILKSN